MLIKPLGVLRISKSKLLLQTTNNKNYYKIVKLRYTTGTILTNELKIEIYQINGSLEILRI